MLKRKGTPKCPVLARSVCLESTAELAVIDVFGESYPVLDLERLPCFSR